jgi:hypothetical protein
MKIYYLENKDPVKIPGLQGHGSHGWASLFKKVNGGEV